MISFKGKQHQSDIILMTVRWYLAYSLSYRDIIELHHMLRKKQFKNPNNKSIIEQFFSLVA